MGKKKKSSGEVSAGGWLTTFTDLMTLLLTFFVLLLSMSVMVEQKKQEALNSVLGAFGILKGGRATIGEEGGTDANEFSSPMQRSEEFDIRVLHNLSMKKDLEPEIEIVKEDNRIVITIGQRVMFLPGSTMLRTGIKDYLTQLCEFIRGTPSKIEIRGYAGRFEAPESNDWPGESWVVSTGRAQAVYQFFYQHGIQVERMSAHGYSYYRPVVDDMAYPHLRDKNRRVDIILGGDAIAVPSRLTKERPKPADHFNYKEFFFKLAPGSAN